MATLCTSPNIADPDGFYAELLAIHAGRDKAESDAINARLLLILANHIGDRGVLRAAFAAAVESTPPVAPETSFSSEGTRI